MDFSANHRHSETMNQTHQKPQNKRAIINCVVFSFIYHIFTFRGKQPAPNLYTVISGSKFNLRYTHRKQASLFAVQRGTLLNPLCPLVCGELHSISLLPPFLPWKYRQLPHFYSPARLPPLSYVTPSPFPYYSPVSYIISPYPFYTLCQPPASNTLLPLFAYHFHLTFPLTLPSP